MAVLSRQKQTDGQTSRFQRQIAFSLLHRTISLSPAGRIYSQQKQAQWPFYQREAQWPFYQSKSKRMARPPDFSDKLHFRYYPARSVYHRPGQAILSKSRPIGRFINARPNGSFIKAEANGWPNLQISATNCIFRYYPARSIYQRPGQAILSKSKPNGRFIKAEANGWPDLFQRQLHFRYYTARSVYHRPGQSILSKSRPNGRFINARPNGRFIKAEANGWPDLQISATNCIFVIIPHDQFISGRAKLFLAKAGLMAVLSARGFTSAQAAIAPHKQFINAALSRSMAILSMMAGLFKAQLPFYQGRPWPLYQGQPQRQFYDGCGGKGQPLDLALGGSIRYCAA